jgi:hypothetical protein
VRRSPKDSVTPADVQGRIRAEDEVLLEAFSIGYRRQYQIAYDEAERQCQKSGMNMVEFLIIECGIFDAAFEADNKAKIRKSKPKLRW